MSYRTCDHIKEDGVSCQSPALRGKKLCFYHHRDHQRQRYVEWVLRRTDPLRPSRPVPRTLFDVQVTLFEVMNALTDNRIHPRRAGKLLFALQQASLPLRNPSTLAE